MVVKNKAIDFYEQALHIMVVACPLKGPRGAALDAMGKAKTSQKTHQEQFIS